MLTLMAPCAAHAQTSGSSTNQGALTIQAGLDTPTLYVFRGIVQEGDPKFTLTPYGELGIALSSRGESTGGLRLSVGVWNSLNTGSSGTGGPLKALHYAEHFYTTLTVGLPKGFTVAPSFRAITSPNRSFTSIKELDLQVARPGPVSPYVFTAFELSDSGQLDNAGKKGSYLEIGAAPNVGLRFLHARLAVPVSAGFSLKNYYELISRSGIATDNHFGFFEIGGHLTIPLAAVHSRFGAWNVHGGADVLRFGTTTKAFNRGSASKVVGTVGIGLSY
jgi:hypothetical protein